VGTGTVYNVTLRGNTIINYEDPNQSYKGNLQGIGLFDGMFENWIVENNLIITDHWHGISFYGAINCKIINNTVVDNNNEPEPDPWIMVNDHKDGTPSSGVIVRNNIATDYSLTGGYTADHNVEITMNNASIYFNSPTGGTGDYHLINSSPAIDAGSGDDAPSIDKDGVARPQGSGWDLGAYEYSDATSVETSKDSPEKFALYQNYPNPFNPTTTISWQSPVSSFQTLKVYDILGNEVAILVNEEKPAGEYDISFDGIGLPSGVYIYQLISGNYIQTRKMLLLK
jgi:parallel beta-helix repeat protein